MNSSHNFLVSLPKELTNTSISFTAVVSTAVASSTAPMTPPNTHVLDSFLKPHAIKSGVSSKLRLLCSYGGQIVPKPHDDKSLCYFGGDTRLISVDRSSSFASFYARLSNMLLNGGSFKLKYQLPNKDLESLITVETDEDLENMIEEYDHTVPGSKRLRLFLFVKSNKLFFDGVELGFSDSVNGLLVLEDNVIDDDGVVNSAEMQLSPPQQPPPLKKQRGQDMQCLLDSQISDASLFSEAASNSPSNANQPHIHVNVEEADKIRAMQDQRLGSEEQLEQSNIESKQVLDQHENGFANTLSPSPMTITLPTVPVSAAPIVSSELLTMVNSDQGLPNGYVKPPTPHTQQQNLPSQHAHQLEANCSGHELPAPNSVSSPSDMLHQEPLSQTTSGSTEVSSLVNPSDPNPIISQNQESINIPRPQFEHSPPQEPPQFIHHHPSSSRPVLTYIHVYPPQQQPCHVYHIISTVPPIFYSVSEAPLSLPYNHMTPAPSSNPEMGHVGAYTTTPSVVTGSQMVHQIPTNTQQFVGNSHIHDPPQSSSTVNPNFDVHDNAHTLIYSTQPMGNPHIMAPPSTDACR